MRKPETRVRILSNKGKHVLSSDVRLHLQKIQQRIIQQEAELEDPDCSDEELNLLEKEAKKLETNLRNSGNSSPPA